MLPPVSHTVVANFQGGLGDSISAVNFPSAEEKKGGLL